MGKVLDQQDDVVDQRMEKVLAQQVDVGDH
jgi:hypothetical protein